MAANKTQPTTASVAAYLGKIDKPDRRADCDALVTLMAKVTGEPATMWGTSIVGFGSYHYRYESGREGDSCLIGFSSRKGDISIYTNLDLDSRGDLLEGLGSFTCGKSCLYVKRLADIDLPRLRALLKATVTELRRRHP